MLGDSGANVIGGALGVVLAMEPGHGSACGADRDRAQILAEGSRSRRSSTASRSSAALDRAGTTPEAQGRLNPNFVVVRFSGSYTPLRKRISIRAAALGEAGGAVVEDGAVAGVGEAVGEIAESAEPLVGGGGTAQTSRARAARNRSGSVMRPWSNCFTDTSTSWSGTCSPARHANPGSSVTTTACDGSARSRAAPARRRRGSHPASRTPTYRRGRSATRPPRSPRARASTGGGAPRGGRQRARRARSRAVATSPTP